MPTTWNPSDKSSSGVTLSGGNLVAAFAATNLGVRSVDRVNTGKYYFEITFTTTANAIIGICILMTPFSTMNSGTAGSLILQCTNGGSIFNQNIGLTSLGGTVTNGWVCCVALDADNRLVWFRNGAGNWNGSAAANPDTGAGGHSIVSWAGPGLPLYVCAQGGGGGGTVTANFGATGFTQTKPTTFTSGFPSGTATIDNAVVTQVGTEVWASNPSVAMQLTQLGLEVWVPATSYTVDSYSGLIRETLLATNGQANVSGLVREVLRSTGSSGVTFAAYSGLVREVLLASGGTAPVTTTQARAIILA